MSRTYVTYAVPVTVVVEDGHVDRVVVMDEEVEMAPDPIIYIDEDSATDRPATPAEAHEAIGIANTDTWPAWEVGW